MGEEPTYWFHNIGSTILDTSVAQDQIDTNSTATMTELSAAELRHIRCLRFVTETTMPLHSDKPQSPSLELLNDRSHKSIHSSMDEELSGTEIPYAAIASSSVAHESEFPDATKECTVAKHMDEEKCVYHIYQIGWSTSQ